MLLLALSCQELPFPGTVLLHLVLNTVAQIKLYVRSILNPLPPFTFPYRCLYLPLSEANIHGMSTSITHGPPDTVRRATSALMCTSYVVWNVYDEEGNWDKVFGVGGQCRAIQHAVMSPVSTTRSQRPSDQIRSAKRHSKLSPYPVL